MKKIITFLMIAISVSFIGCTTGTTDLGYKLAQENKYTKSFKYDFNKEELTKAVVLALQDREWKIVSNSPIKATLNHREYDAKLTISVEDNLVVFNAEGTTLSGEKFMPLRLIDFIKKSIDKHLVKPAAVVNEAVKQ